MGKTIPSGSCKTGNRPRFDEVVSVLFYRFLSRPDPSPFCLTQSCFCLSWSSVSSTTFHTLVHRVCFKLSRTTKIFLNHYKDFYTFKENRLKINSTIFVFDHLNHRLVIVL